ncbi:MAG: aminodeoxychorismate lyase [Klebsiella michiganensis]|uniref:aminodeoxychorismate lyase n=1 Tax=Pluralibacter gergoviae TaxID=61647 RepID=UPI0004F66254|nr:aminodeoxychorismate lyase [Pluralibacter gergoviae]MDU4390142.1 aminodeoxychorismate lyase [Klebsiella michiganensis]AIR01841.1 aminodeoxychorismate lyase [Pluralibacter gergoviae]EKW6617833.1 aminodeoxychorismate lyase [Pluralibacter gergoviae]ELG9927626.1 aminodeoxychorismate lyase [Pluralibacter gergoviae]ELK5594127.1 aminodeoxychorismate lyase [Pluralibacter gergoviae]
MFLINGTEQSTLAAGDRGLQFGDGCFTTARVRKGQVEQRDKHLARLRHTCEALLIPFSAWGALDDEMVRLAAAQQEGVLKVILTRGSGGRGYSAAACGTPTRILSTSPFPDHFSRWRQQGVTLSLSPVRLGRNPALAGLKHLNRLEQVLIRTHLEQTGADEALVLDSEGWVTECCAANLFWRAGETVFTPRVDQAGVNGIMRQHCLRLLAQSRYRVVEVSAQADAVRQADEVIICNALLPVAAVSAFDEVRYLSRELFEYLAPLCEQSMTS